MKQKVDVIQLGLKVSRDWWKASSRDYPAPLETREEHMFGQVDIVLASMPLREFALYWNEIDYEPKNVDRIWKSVRDSREKHGWKEIEKDKYFPSSLQPITIENKYFKVQPLHAETWVFKIAHYLIGAIG